MLRKLKSLQTEKIKRKQKKYKNFGINKRKKRILTKLEKRKREEKQLSLGWDDKDVVLRF